MLTLRNKLWLGVGGLLIVLLMVSAISAVVLTKYSHRIERMFRDNYDSAVYCDAMKSALNRLNRRALRIIWGDTSAELDNTSDAKDEFEQNLKFQIANSYLPGELQHTQHLQEQWNLYRKQYEQFDSDANHRHAIYQSELLPRFEDMNSVAQQITDINVKTMSSTDSQMKGTLVAVRNSLLVFVAAGMILAGAVLWAVGYAILKPLRTLTKSARQIEAGDLDLSLAVRSGDEVGELAHAFNSMTAKLREFRRLDHDRLARTEQTTQLAIDSLPDAVFVIDPNGKVEISNSTARTHLNIVPGATVSALALPWLTTLYEAVKHERKASEPRGYKSAIQLFEDGEEKFLLPRGIPIVGTNDELIGITIILVDITNLHRVDEAKSSVLSTVSHELRTPLTGMRMSLSMLASEKFGPVSINQKKLINASREDSDRLYRIIDNLLNISRIESGRSQFQFGEMSPADIIANALNPLRSVFAERKINLKLLLPNDLPSVRADAPSIGSALTNLLTNALKFTPTGGDVVVEAHAKQNRVCFIVHDTGPGIPAEFQRRIFEKFFRVPRKSGPSGAGLGLTIAKEIIEAHRGEIGFECPDGGGTIFWFALPATT